MKRFSVLLTLCLCSLPGFRPVFAAEPVITASQPAAAASCPYVLDRNNSRSQAGLESDIDLYSLLPERPVFRRMPRPDRIAGGTLLEIREQELQTARRLRDLILTDSTPAELKVAEVPGPLDARHPIDLPVLHEELPAAVVEIEGPAAPPLAERAPVEEAVTEVIEEAAVETVAVSQPAADLPAREPVVALRPELPVVAEVPVAVELPTVAADLPAREPVVAVRPELPVVAEAVVAAELPIPAADLPSREPVVAVRPELPEVAEAVVAAELPVVVEAPVAAELPTELADLPAREPVVAPRPEVTEVEVIIVAIETRQPASLLADETTSEYGYPLSFDYLVQMPLPAAEPVAGIVTETVVEDSILTDTADIAVTTVETTEDTITELDDPAGIDDAVEYVDSAAAGVADPEDLDLNLNFGFEQLPSVQIDTIETQDVSTTDEAIELEQAPQAEEPAIDSVEETELRQDAAVDLQIPTDEPVEEDEFELFYGLDAPSPADG